MKNLKLFIATVFAVLTMSIYGQSAGDITAQGILACQKGNYAEAHKYYKQAADLGFAPAMTQLGLLYEFGLGVTQNYYTAAEWYKKAADLGDETAMDRVKELKQYVQPATPATKPTTKPVAEPVAEDVPEEVVEVESSDPVFVSVDEMPEFPGGTTKAQGYIQRHLRYPQLARESGITGRVFVEFIVEQDGTISHVGILRGLGGGCDEEAIRVIRSMPKWKPGKQNGQAVRVKYTLPVVFK